MRNRGKRKKERTRGNLKEITEGRNEKNKEERLARKQRMTGGFERKKRGKNKKTEGDLKGEITENKRLYRKNKTRNKRKNEIQREDERRGGTTKRNTEDDI